MSNARYAQFWLISFVTILFALQACTPTGEKFVPQNTQETIAYASISIKAFSKSVKSAYAAKLITQEAALTAAARLQTAQTALELANGATTQEAQQSALSTAQAALTIVAQILESMQEPQP